MARVPNRTRPFCNRLLLGVAMSRIPRPKNAAPNTIFTSFDENNDGFLGTIRYSGEPIPVLNDDGSQNFTVPVAWGYLGVADSDPTDARDWAPCGSCRMSAEQRKAVPQRVRDAENGSCLEQAYTVWFEYLLDEAAKP